MTTKRDYFNDLAPRWDGFPSPADTPVRVARFVNRSLPAHARRVLDAGCGTGLLLGPLLTGQGRTLQIVELDIAEHMLMESKRRADGYGSVEHVCADALHLPFRDAAFDAALCFNSLPHMVPMPDVLHCLLRCLHPAGTLAVGHLMGSRDLNAFHANVGGVVREDYLPPADALAGMLRQMGAEVLGCEEAADWYFVQARKSAE